MSQMKKPRGFLFFGLTQDGQDFGDAVNAAALCKMP
jgi:hypothetical protein